MFPLIADPTEYGEGGEGLEAVLQEFGQEFALDPKFNELYSMRKRYHVTEGRKKFERKNTLRKRMWRREMNNRLEPIAKTFGNLTPEDWMYCFYFKARVFPQIDVFFLKVSCNLRVLLHWLNFLWIAVAEDFIMMATSFFIFCFFLFIFCFFFFSLAFVLSLFFFSFFVVIILYIYFSFGFF